MFGRLQAEGIEAKDYIQFFSLHTWSRPRLQSLFSNITSVYSWILLPKSIVRERSHQMKTRTDSGTTTTVRKTRLFGHLGQEPRKPILEASGHAEGALGIGKECISCSCDGFFLGCRQCPTASTVPLDVENIRLSRRKPASKSTVMEAGETSLSTAKHGFVPRHIYQKQSKWYCYVGHCPLDQQQQQQYQRRQKQQFPQQPQQQHQQALANQQAALVTNGEGTTELRNGSRTLHFHVDSIGMETARTWNA